MIKIKKSKKSIILFGVIFVAALAGAGYYLYEKSQDKTSESVAQSPSGDPINFNPPTEQEKQSAEQNKQAILEREQQRQNQPTNNGKKAVKPVITYSGQYGSQVEVGGYVPGIFEETGTCTAHFTNGSKVFTKTVNAITNVKTTDCPAMTASSGEFSPKGVWNVAISYSSPTASGSSDSKTVEVR